MTRENFDDLPEAERAHFYECPACGEMADNRQADEVRLHHDHVLRPRPSGSPPRQHQASAAVWFRARA